MSVEKMTPEEAKEYGSRQIEHYKMRDRCMESNVEHSGFVVFPVWDDDEEVNKLKAFRRSDFIKAESYDDLGLDGEEHDGDPWSVVSFRTDVLPTEYRVRLSVREVVELLASTRGYFEK